MINVYSRWCVCSDHHDHCTKDHIEVYLKQESQKNRITLIPITCLQMTSNLRTAQSQIYDANKPNMNTFLEQTEQSNAMYEDIASHK